MTMRSINLAAATFAFFSAPVAALAQQPAAPTIVLTGEEAPNSRAWTQPASLTYVDSSDDGEDRTQLNAALKVSGRMPGQTANTWFVRGVAQVSDRASKEQETYALQVGWHFEPDEIRTSGGLPDPNALNVFTDVSLGFNSKAVFANPAAAACVADPSLPACSTQHERSLRLAVDVQPHLAAWEQTYETRIVDGRPRTSDVWARSFAPRALIFYDEVTDAVINAAGARAEGGVAGVKLSASLALAPPILEHRFVFRASVQHVHALHVADARASTFDADTTLFTASADYEFGTRSFSADGAPTGWSPSVGVTYSDGSDALAGRADKDDVTIAFRLTYRGG